MFDSGTESVLLSCAPDKTDQEFMVVPSAGIHVPGISFKMSILSSYI